MRRRKQPPQPLKIMTNQELTLDQLHSISGAGKEEREARRAARQERRAERKHNRTCPDGWPSSDCPYGADETTGDDNHELDTVPGCEPMGPCI